MPGVDMLHNSVAISKSVLLAIVLAPLFGAILAGLFGRRIGRAGAHSVTILGVAYRRDVGAGVEVDGSIGQQRHGVDWQWRTE